MNFYKLFLTFVFSMAFCSMYAQWCGNVASQVDIDRLLKNKLAVENGITTRNNMTTYVPVKFHIVRESNGDGGVKESLVAAQLCALNNDYAPLDIVFFAKDESFNYINSTLLYENPTIGASESKMSSEKQINGQGAINVFICENANTGGLGTTLGYYDPQFDLVVMRKSEVNGFTGTLSHELGHFFSLLHVFNGWDGVAWEADVHGNPVNSATSPGGVPNELASGSNCNNSGDFLCDTPADYNLGFNWLGCSNYGGGCMDVNGEALDPDEENFMSYFIGCDQYFFSDDQQSMIFADYNSSGRAFLETSYVPNVGPLSEDVVLKSPADGEVTENFNFVELDWNTIDNAMGYYVEVKRALSKWEYFTTQSYLVMDELSADREYTWKVLAFTETGGCAEFTESQTFTTGTTVSTNDLSEFNIAINPTVIQSDALNIDINSTSLSTVSLYSINGTLIQQVDKTLTKGSNSIDISSEMSAGMYVVQIQIQNKTQAYKIIVQ